LPVCTGLHLVEAAKHFKDRLVWAKFFQKLAGPLNCPKLRGRDARVFRDGEPPHGGSGGMSFAPPSLSYGVRPPRKIMRWVHAIFRCALR
jgi:hypothetical protein